VDESCIQRINPSDRGQGDADRVDPKRPVKVHAGLVNFVVRIVRDIVRDEGTAGQRGQPRSGRAARSPY
jgi:hypothetical protein